MYFPKLIDDILEGGTDEEALERARGICEYETHSAEIGYARYIDTVNGIEVHYDYGADYYFFAEA